MSHTLKQKAYDHIRDRLLAGQLRHGERLSPAELAREIGVSHIPVREAITQLQSEGLVEQIPRLGAFVKAPDKREIFELHDVRQALECHAVAKAARRITDDQIVQLETHCNTLRELVDLAQSGKIKKNAELGTRWAAADQSLHMVLLNAAGNQRLMKMICDARLLTRLFAYSLDARKPVTELVDDYRKNYQVHRAILDAIKKRDPKAARAAMAQHFRRGRENLNSYFRLLERQTPAGARM